MAPHYDRHADPSAEQNAPRDMTSSGPDDNAIEDAAEALRQAEVESVRPEPEVPDVSSLDAAQLERMSIDELRVVARKLEIPERGQITEQDELIAEIRRRL